MTRSLFFLPFLFVVTQVLAQKTDTLKQKPRTITWKDVSNWRSMNNAKLSPNGNWVAYTLVTVEGDGELILQKIKDTIQKRFPIGGNSSAQFVFSDDGNWLAFKEYSKYKEINAAAKMPGKQLFEKLILLNLTNDKKTEFQRAGSFGFNGKASSYLAVGIAKERTMTPRPGESTGSDLVLLELATDKRQNIGNVGEFQFDKNGGLLAYTISAAEQAGNGLFMLNLTNKQITVLDNDSTTYKSLKWKEDKDALTVLKMTKDAKFKTDKGKVLGVKNSAARPIVVSYDPVKDSLDFPKNMTVSGNRSPEWSDDLTSIFFGISPLEPVKKDPPKDTSKVASKPVPKDSTLTLEKLKADTTIKNIDDLKKALAKTEATRPRPVAPLPAANPDITKPDMTIWHWKDKRLQSRQQMTEMTDKNISYLAVYDMNSKKFRQLNDSSMRSIFLLPKYKFALGEDIRNYELEQSLDGQTYSDIYIINVKDGSKQLFKSKFYRPSYSSSPRPSPDGEKFVFGEDGNFYLYDIPKQKTSSLTQAIPTSFINTDDDHNVTKPLTNLLGWSSDSRYVLIADLWDVWQIPVSGNGKASNLTQDGAATQTRYQMRYTLDPDEKGFDLSKPNYFRSYGEWNKKSGIVRILPGSSGLKPGATKLLWDDINVVLLGKAKNTDTYMFGTEKFNQPTEMYVANALLQNPVKATKNAPDADKYLWSPGTQLVNYVTEKGDSLQGTLFLPAGYEKGKKYPTLVYYYEKLSQTKNNYSNPGFPGGGWHPGMYTANGYAVFIPDIVYKLDDPGMSAVWAVLPAVKAAIQTGVIDENKVGITGHSWGGYQTAFLVTQTNMFKAAAAGAALTDMVSMYNLIYWNSGNGNMSIFEASQGRFKGAPWENWDSYLRNSPIYHVKKVQTPLLMLHNDKDGAVDFTQGVEYYNALRRLQKPVVMLQYKGENHGLMKLENRKDYAVRMMEFFDHYLKGKPAPAWWQEGVDRIKLTEHLEGRAF